MALIHPEDKLQLTAVLQDCLTGKFDNYRSEYRILCKDGNWKWVLARGAVVLRAGDGGALRMIGTLVDVAHDKAVETDLVAASLFQNAIFDAISAQIAVLDASGKLVLTNSAWCRFMTELEVRETIGASYLEILEKVFAADPVLVASVTSGMAALVKGQVLHFDVPKPVQSRCGRWWFTIRITPIHDAANRMVVTHEDVTSLKRAELASLALANVDDLTGALSRQNFMDLAEQELARSRRYKLPLVLLMMDLDHFKRVNDSYGHPTGDAVLCSFVQTVKDVLRESDVIGRIGGEEFAVLLPNTTQDGACTLARRIVAAVQAKPAVHEQQCINYTVSIGASALSHHKSFGELLAQCDAALYLAKNAGRNRLEVSWNSTAQCPDEAPLVTLR